MDALLNPYTFSTQDYEIRNTISQFLVPGKNVYQVANRQTGVIEYETHRLPDALDAVKHFQKLLDDFRRGVTGGELMPMPSLLPPGGLN